MKKIKKHELTREQIELAMQCESPVDLVKLAKERDYEMTEAEADAYLTELADFKLDSEQLKKVAGGYCYSYDCPTDKCSEND